MEKESQKGDYLNILLRSSKTVFSLTDVVLLWKENNMNAIKVRINYYVKKGKLMRIRKGLYAKDQNYNKKELATKILKPSYVSFETVLGSSGVTFQYYSQIFIASYINRELVCDGQQYSFRRIDKNILTNPLGIEMKEEYSIASPERAFLDVVYRTNDYHFDNLSGLNWEKVFEIMPIYNSKKVEKRVKKYYEAYRSNE